MASIQEIIGVGTPPILARMLGQNRLRTILAEGSSQADANPLTVNFGTIGTSAPGQGVRLGYARAAALTALFNLGPDSVLVYPAEGDTLNDLGADLAITVPAGNLLIAVPSMDHWLALSSPGDLGSFADAPADGGIYAREDGAWVPAVEEAPEDGQPYVRAEGDWVVMPVPPPSGTDAPLDGLAYGRAMGDWAPVAEEAPEDGGLYGRQSLGWAPVPPPGIAEAPEDGGLYGRQSLGWAPVPPPGIAEAPADGFPYQRYGAAWTRLAALFPAMFGAAPDGSDATAALQAGLDAACNFGLEFVIVGGQFSVTGLTVYSGATLRFAGGGSLKLIGSGVPCLKTWLAPGQPPAVGAGTITGLQILRPVIDMGGNSGCAILLEDCAWGVIEQPVVKNTGGGTWVYPSTEGTTTCPDGAIVVTATGGLNSYSFYNKILMPQLINTGTKRGTAIFFTATDNSPSGFPNYNKIEGGWATGFNIGINVHQGSDTVIDWVDVSSNNIGYLIGDGWHPVQRTRIIKPYCEGCTVGIHLGPFQSRTIVEGSASWAGTVTPIVEDPPQAGLCAAQYVNLDTDAADNANYLANWTAAAGGLWNVVSGAGGISSSGIAHIAYGTPAFLLGRYNGKPQAKTPITSGQSLGTFGVYGFDGADLQLAPILSWFAEENWTASAHGCRFAIAVVAPGSISRVNEIVVRATGTTLLHGLGAWGLTPPPSQPTTAGSTRTVAAGSTTQVFTNTTFDGNQGTVGYTIGDLVKILKNYGLIAN